MNGERWNASSEKVPSPSEARSGMGFEKTDAGKTDKHVEPHKRLVYKCLVF